MSCSMAVLVWVPESCPATRFLIGFIVISLSRCCLPNDEGPGPKYFLPRTATGHVNWSNNRLSLESSIVKITSFSRKRLSCDILLVSHTLNIVKNTRSSPLTSISRILRFCHYLNHHKLHVGLRSLKTPTPK